MKVTQGCWDKQGAVKVQFDGAIAKYAQLVLAFGSREMLENKENYEKIARAFPSAMIAICSTSGEIFQTQVSDDTITATGMMFERTPLCAFRLNAHDFNSSKDLGSALASQFNQKDLKHIFILSDGQMVNGSALVEGLSSALPKTVSITGGLAGDAARFSKTLVGLDAPPVEGEVVAIGFYGEHIRVGFGSKGGWDAFGPLRRVTSSKENILFELDGKNALELYKTYLGDQAKGLPSTGLLFPLAVRSADGAEPVVRTILSVDPVKGTMTFAGNIPEGSKAQLMRSNFDQLIDGAAFAANSSFERLGSKNPEVAILISCVGRKLLLGQRTEEEVESVRKIVGEKTVMTGFYSYGEISPLMSDCSCALHNQTMTITTLSEK
jgi:hypothetical protein